MLVKEKWSELSEQQMYEWSLATPTAYNRKKRAHYTWWQTVKNEPVEWMSFDDIMRLCDIREIQKTENKRPSYRRR